MKGFLIVPLSLSFAALQLWAPPSWGQGSPAAPAGASAASASSAASGSTAAPGFTDSTNLLGKLFGVSFATSSNTAQNGMTLSLNATILGSTKPLVQGSVEPSANFQDGNLQVYVNGAQISSVSGAFANANWTDAVTFPTINTTGTIVSVPIGPLVIEVDGGFSLSGNLSTDIGLEAGVGQGAVPVPGPSGGSATTVPGEITASLATNVASAGFIKGSVSFIFIRGGVEGQISLADGTVNTTADLYFAKMTPTFTANGKLAFFGGAVSAFADFNSFFAGWINFWNWTIFSWKGYCINFANLATTAGVCQ